MEPICPACRGIIQFDAAWLEALCPAHRKQVYDALVIHLPRILELMFGESTQMDIGSDVPGGGAS